MVYARAELSALEVERYEADLPHLAAFQAAARAVQPAGWRTSGQLGVGVDSAEPGYPSGLAYDGSHGQVTRARLGTGLGTYFVFELDDVAFDSVILPVHNFGELNALVNPAASLQVANSADFSADLETICSWGPADFDRRLVSLTLGFGNPGVLVAARYSGVRYLRLAITYDGTPPHPEFGELFLLTRRALPERPKVPFDELQMESRVDVHEADAGEQHPHTRYAKRLVLNAEWDPDTASYEALFRNFYRDCGFGTEPFVWLPRPFSAPSDAYVMRLTPAAIGRFELPQVENPSNRVARISALEQSPFVEDEG